jgi:hypothetical protein
MQFDSTLQIPLDLFEKIAEVAGLRKLGSVTNIRKQPWMEAQSSQMLIDLVCEGAL